MGTDRDVTNSDSATATEGELSGLGGQAELF